MNTNVKTKRSTNLLHKGVSFTNNRKPFRKNLLASISLIFVLFSVLGVPSAQGAELYFGAHSKEVGVGKTFEIGVFLNTEGQYINALEGTVIFPSNVEIVDIIDGNSIISFWVERPHSDARGEASFAGTVPGGYFGEKGYLFSLVFKAKEKGSVTFETTNESILLHDGEGTKTTVNRAPLSLEIVSESKTEEFLPPHDPDLPESFPLAISQNPSIFENQYFLVFATQDKISGIDHFEVKETRYKRQGEGARGWRIAESPYLLQDQKLNSYIFVKAVDKAGNERITMLSPENPFFGYKNYKLWIIIILIGFMLYLATHRSLWKTVISILKLKR